VRQHLGDRHKPQAGIAEERRRRRPRFCCVGCRRCLRGGWCLGRPGGSAGLSAGARSECERQQTDDGYASCHWSSPTKPLVAVAHSTWSGGAALSGPAPGSGTTGSTGGTIKRPRPPRLTCPPFRPAERASSAVHSWAVPFSCAARPPLLAISRCFSGDIDANPRRSLRSPVFTATPPCSVQAGTSPACAARRMNRIRAAGAEDPGYAGDVARCCSSAMSPACRCVVLVVVVFPFAVAARDARDTFTRADPQHVPGAIKLCASCDPATATSKLIRGNGLRSLNFGKSNKSLQQFTTVGLAFTY
jgi:hypothetical protein